MAKTKDTAADDAWKVQLDRLQKRHKAEGKPPIDPTPLPSGQVYTPSDSADADYIPPQGDQNPTPGMKKGGKVKRKSQRGHGIAQKGYKKAKIL